MDKKIKGNGTETAQEVSRKVINATMRGKLDEYFEMMMKASGVDDRTQAVYEMAVRAFINDISYNGLPTIRRERFNRELKVSLAMLGLDQ